MTSSLPIRAGLFALLLAAAAASAQTPETLRKGDALLIRIDRVGGGIPAYREIVDSDGQIEMPFLGFLAAESQTIAAVETQMAASYTAARLSSNATASITYVAHFDPAPDRSQLVRIDPHVPVPVDSLPAP